MKQKLETGNQRLLFLAAFLDTVNEDRFNLETWRRGEYVHVITDEVLLHDCGTTACAVGWACSLPEFRELGLGFHEYYPTLETDDLGRLHTWDAVERFFDLDSAESSYLFIYTQYSSTNSAPRDVADRIREFVMERTVL